MWGSLERTVAYVTNLSSSHVGVLYVENNLASTTRMFQFWHLCDISLRSAVCTLLQTNLRRRPSIRQEQGTDNTGGARIVQSTPAATRSPPLYQSTESTTSGPPMRNSLLTPPDCSGNNPQFSRPAWGMGGGVNEGESGTNKILWQHASDWGSNMPQLLQIEDVKTWYWSKKMCQNGAPQTPYPVLGFKTLEQRTTVAVPRVLNVISHSSYFL